LHIRLVTIDRLQRSTQGKIPPCGYFVTLFLRKSAGFLFDNANTGHF
jgi:hypothetical protein